VEAGEQLLPLRGQRDDRPAPVGAVAAPFDQPAVLQAVQDRDQVGAVDAEQPGQRLLSRGPLLVQVLEREPFTRPQAGGCGRVRLERTAAALAGRGFLAQIADSAKEARRLALEAIPPGAEVHVALSETMRELGITAEIDSSGRYESVRARLNALDRVTQAQER